MNLTVFPGVKKKNSELNEPEVCLFSRPHLKINESDFFLDIKNVARYRVQNGETMLYSPYEGADEASINLFLEGSALGALLHQRGIIPFHGSSFVYKGRGITLCGRSGTGKSSITAAFCQQGARFINDDITPINITNSKAIIIPIKTRIKLWDDALLNLKIENNNLQRIRPELNKFYLPMKKNPDSEFLLHHIFVLYSHNNDEFEAKELSGIAKYNALRHQIYRRIYLKGMPATEKKYFTQLFSLANKTKITAIKRPKECDIRDAMCFVEKQIEL